MVFLRQFVVFCSLGAALFACASSPGFIASLEIGEAVRLTQAEDEAPARLRRDVAWLAGDQRAGRKVGGEGYQQAADYVAARMAALGMRPGADGEWFQEFQLRSGVPEPVSVLAMSIAGPDGALETLEPLVDFYLSGSLERERSEVQNAAAVFVGYGISAPSLGYDDYENVDLEGKVAVFFFGAPESFDSISRAHFGAQSEKVRQAASRGAIAVISVLDAEAEKSRMWVQRFSRAEQAQSTGRAQVTWLGPDGLIGPARRGIRVIATPSSKKAPLLFAGSGHSYAQLRADADAPGKPLPHFDLAVRVSLSGAMRFETLTSMNVVGLIEGGDPVLKKEFVVMTAHLDHVGVDEKRIAEGEDGIKNGAMDNAVGVSVMLDVGRRILSGERPARSVLLIALTGEEVGLLGADYFMHYPTIGDGEMVANVNLDMPVMLHHFTDVVAFGAERSSLGAIVKSALSQSGVALSSDPVPQLNIFTRSDHYRFVVKAIPSIYLWPGFANNGEEKFWDFYDQHYHAPSDDLALPIRYGDMARFAHINALIVQAIANDPTKPSWNEGEFFGAPHE